MGIFRRNPPREFTEENQVKLNTLLPDYDGDTWDFQGVSGTGLPERRPAAGPLRVVVAGEMAHETPAEPPPPAPLPHLTAEQVAELVQQGNEARDQGSAEWLAAGQQADADFRRAMDVDVAARQERVAAYNTGWAERINAYSDEAYAINTARCEQRGVRRAAS